MKTNSTNQLAKVINNFLDNKFTFKLDSDEKENLFTTLMDGLTQLEENHQMSCLDINQIQVYDTTYYTFTFESLITASTVQRKNEISTAAIHFMNDFTDHDGMFISFNQLDRNHWVFQLNFLIA